MKWENIDAKRFIIGLRDRIEKGETALEMRIKNLEAEMKVLKQRGLRYEGVFQKAQLPNYGLGSVITFSGGLWICCLEAPKGNPETDPDHWQLAVKSGRDAR